MLCVCLGVIAYPHKFRSRDDSYDSYEQFVTIILHALTSRLQNIVSECEARRLSSQTPFTPYVYLGKGYVNSVVYFKCAQLVPLLRYYIITFIKTFKILLIRMVTLSTQSKQRLVVELQSLVNSKTTAWKSQCMKISGHPTWSTSKICICFQIISFFVNHHPKIKYPRVRYRLLKHWMGWKLIL